MRGSCRASYIRPRKSPCMAPRGSAACRRPRLPACFSNAAAADGSLDLERFGQVALRRIRPVLSFKILANMPICFVSIFENLRGPNAVYTPWEGQGAQAIAAGVRAVAEGEVPCAVVGGCDVKTHALAFLSLQQLGVFDSWRRHGAGSVPGEGAAFLVLEERAAAVRRGARVYATVRRHAAGSTLAAVRTIWRKSFRRCFVDWTFQPMSGAVLAGDGDRACSEAEREAMEAVGIDSRGQSHFRGGMPSIAAPRIGQSPANRCVPSRIWETCLPLRRRCRWPWPPCWPIGANARRSWPTASATAPSKPRFCWRPHEPSGHHGHRRGQSRRHRPRGLLVEPRGRPVGDRADHAVRRLDLPRAHRRRSPRL